MLSKEQERSSERREPSGRMNSERLQQARECKQKSSKQLFGCSSADVRRCNVDSPIRRRARVQTTAIPESATKERPSIAVISPATNSAQYTWAVLIVLTPFSQPCSFTPFYFWLDTAIKNQIALNRGRRRRRKEPKHQQRFSFCPVVTSNSLCDYFDSPTGSSEQQVLA